LWAEDLLTANYTRNRTPVSAHGKTPTEVFFGKKSNVGHMRVFGAQAYVHVPKEKRHKLAPVSEKGVFVGYPGGVKGYKVLRERDGKVIVARDVIFDERPPKARAATAPATEVETVSAARGNQPQSPGAFEEQTDVPSGEIEIELGVAETMRAAGTGVAQTGPGAGPTAPGEVDLGGGAEEHTGPDARRYPTRERVLPARYRANLAIGNGTGAPKSEEHPRGSGEHPEPQPYQKAVGGEESELWQQSMNEAIQSLPLENKTWELVQKLEGVKPVPMKWVYKIKRDAEGNVEHYKSRLVAKGFMQRAGIDFKEVYAPLSKHTTMRALLATIAPRDLELDQLDVKTTFLNGELKEGIYMRQPRGYEQGGPEMMCRLRHTLYGLRQAPRGWHMRLKEELELPGFRASEADATLFTGDIDGERVYLVVWVDDILIAARREQRVAAVKAHLAAKFDVRDLGEAKFLLKMELTRDRAERTLTLTQKKLTRALVERYGLTVTGARARSVPLGPGAKADQGG
jgi:hypothetical protein